MKPQLVIIGLGNPGEEYAHTRHNIGFAALDALSKTFGTETWSKKKKFAALIEETEIESVSVLLVKPETFMNRSGESARAIVDFFQLDALSQMLVIVDDIDLPLGEIRYRASGGPGSHNGLRSLDATIGPAYPRVRIGLGTHPDGAELANWVLSIPPESERIILTQSIDRFPELIKHYVQKHEWQR